MEKILVAFFKNSEKKETLEYPPYKEYMEIKEDIIKGEYEKKYSLAEIKFPNTSPILLSFNTPITEER